MYVSKLLSCLLNSCASELRTELERAFWKRKQKVLNRRHGVLWGGGLGRFFLSVLCAWKTVAVRYCYPPPQIFVWQRAAVMCHIPWRGDGQERRTRAEGAALELCLGATGWPSAWWWCQEASRCAEMVVGLIFSSGREEDGSSASLSLTGSGEIPLSPLL